LTSGFVADSSVGVAWAAASQSSDETRSLLDEVAAGRPCVIPGLWMFEVANTLLVLVRRRRISADEYARARHDLTELRPVVDDEGPHLAFGETLELANKHALSVYDAAYLELALRKSLPLASRDEALNKAAGRAGVKTMLD
jgi:predicted nucleic acid-binding protein